MRARKYTVITIILALVFWFVDAAIHYFVYKEPRFEFIPNDFNELWMRSVIILLIILFGIYADYSTKKLLAKEKQLEATRIYNSMTYASQHILNNMLNQMLLFKIEALKSKDFDKEIINIYDDTIAETRDLLKRLSQVEHITDENIWASVDPDKLASSSKKADSAHAKTGTDD